MEDYFAAKRRLFDMLPADAPAVINLDDPRGASLVDIVRRPVTYGLTRTAQVSPSALSYSLEGLQFDIGSPRGPIRVRTKLVGRPNVYNILAAVAVTGALEVPTAAMAAAIAPSVAPTAPPTPAPSVALFPSSVWAPSAK